eukprot:6490264-Amphidinium_carterae.2
MAMEFAGLPMVRHSFTGITCYATIPGSRAENTSRDAYNAYQQCLRQRLPANQVGSAEKLNYLQWLRKFKVAKKKTTEQGATYEVVKLGGTNQFHNRPVAVAIKFPFEMLDIYIGSFAAALLR